jgi:hypothetical protein
MNRYIFIHRMIGPAVLLLLGVVALLSQAHLVHFSIFIPLVMILIGVIQLAERMALSGCDYSGPATGYGPGMGPQAPGATTYGSDTYGSGPASTSTSIVPAPPHFGNGNDGEGGQQ